MRNQRLKVEHILHRHRIISDGRSSLWIINSVASSLDDARCQRLEFLLAIEVRQRVYNDAANSTNNKAHAGRSGG